MFGNDEDTKLLLHCDGVDTSTSFPDVSASVHTITANGDAQVDTAQSKFGDASGLFDGTGDYLSASDHADWAVGSGNFTVDLWVRFADIASDRALWGQVTGVPATSYTGAFWDQSANKLTFVDDAGISVTGAFTPVANTWYHLALVRNGNDYVWYVDGSSVAMAGTPDATAVTDQSTDFYVGRFAQAGVQYMNGWIDEFRFSKGIARWTANFTPETEAYAGYERIMPACLPHEHWQEPMLAQPLTVKSVEEVPPQPDVMITKHYGEARGLYRIFNAAAYELWRKNGSAPDWDSDSPFATASSLPDTPADTYSDATWYLAMTYNNGVIRSGFYPVGPEGEPYRVMIVSGGAAEDSPPTGAMDDTLTALAGGVIRVSAVYIPWLDGSTNRATEWSINYTTDGSTPSEDAAGGTTTKANVTMGTAGTVETLWYELPAQADGTTVKVRVQTRRDDGGYIYSNGSQVLTATADDAGPSAPASGDTWRGRLPEEF